MNKVYHDSRPQSETLDALLDQPRTRSAKNLVRRHGYNRLSVDATSANNTHLPTAEFHTLDGLLLARLRHIPEKGESLARSGFRFTVAPRAM